MAVPFLDRLVELFKDDEELHDALVEYIKSQTEANIALAEWRRKRNG